MSNRITYKATSERGASITFALLLFLVCIVIASIVITAASAAAGRLSQLAKTDQRYYSVTSAAKIIAKQFPQTVRIEREYNYIETSTTKYSMTETPLSYEGVTSSVKTDKENPYKTMVQRLDSSSGSYINIPSNYANAGLSAILAEIIVHGKYTDITEEGGKNKDTFDKNLFETMPDLSGILGKLELNFGESYPELDVNIDASFQSAGVSQTNGSVVLTLTNKNSSEKFSLRMILTPEIISEDIPKYEETITSASTSTSGNVLTEVVVSDCIDKKIDTITWSVAEILNGGVVV